MIKIEQYTDDFEEEYWKVVEKKIERNIRNKIMKSCKKFLPPDFFDSRKISFKTLVLTPFDKLKLADKYFNEKVKNKVKSECFDPNSVHVSKINDLYFFVYEAYKKVADSKKMGKSVRVRIVENTEFTVCPYCNRDYINSRDKDISGAQLDHFFSKSENPLFAVCLYNLVPVCGNCNRVKSSKNMEFASPFDNSIDWEKEVTFTYDEAKTIGNKINIKTLNKPIQNNINEMHIEEAYQIHEAEIIELFENIKSYNKTQNEEFKKVLYKIDLTDGEIKKAIFGDEITQEKMKKKPLGKMLSDLHKEYKVYN